MNPKTGLTPERLKRLLTLVRSHYPDWDGFDHPAFHRDEIGYKQQAVRKAAETLSRQELQRLLDERKSSEIVARIRSLPTNLLYVSTPSTGDLALLYNERLDPAAFVEALIDLVHGRGDSPERLERFVAWARERDLPVRWPLPTYLLFLAHPNRDYFVKPGVTRWFLELVGNQDLYSPEPTGDIYAHILDSVHELKHRLAEFRPRDMVDVQSFIWVAHNAATGEPRCWKIAPDSGARMWDECRTGGFIAIGWEELEDVGRMSRKEFEDRRDLLLDRHKGEREWTPDGLEQVWKFAHVIREGDKIVANKGTSLVLGIGTVSGLYEFIPDAYYGHRLPVDWEDTRPRAVQEGNWRRTLLELSREKFEKIQRSKPVEAEGGEQGQGFSQRTFELLEGIQKDPTRAFYLEHKDDFRTHVEVPFQDIFRAAISDLSAPIKELMETQESLFGRIPKNDYGRGGAWPFYWGALYPKGGQRIRDAQLSLWINQSRFRIGFYIGEYGSEQRALFVRNCVRHRDAIVRWLGDRLSNSRLVYGSRELPENLNVGWQDWLADPGRFGLSVGVDYTALDVLKADSESLRRDIAVTWELLFPLVLLAVHEEPLEPLLRYLGEAPEVTSSPMNPEYPLSECARETGLDPEVLQRWVAAVHRKGQAILYGPPGTGKTHLARQLARHLAGGGRGFVELVQFHPSYSYEEFIQGIRPEVRPNGGLDYPLKKGRFLEFCERASEKGEEDVCVLIVDEINRANLSRVFGELMYLLEYRGDEVPLAGGRRFRIPANVRLLGTMNTADRSIALVDHALRRRFAFLSLRPDFDVLRRFHAGNGFPVERLVSLLQRLNADIRDPHYEVGITFFLRRDLANELEDIWRMEIVPYLEEYFFDQPGKVDAYRWEQVQRDLEA